jgi:cyclopropane-fatty-acyl-phospholipid synthase
VVHRRGVGPDQVAGDQVVRARTAAGAAAAACSARGGSVTSTQQQASTGVIDPVQWADVAAVRGSAARAEIARGLFRAAASRLPIRVRLPGGRQIGAGAPGAPVMVVHNPAAFYTRLGSGGLIGFGESYLAGEWDCADLTGLLTVFATHVADLVPGPLQRMRRLAVRRTPAADENTKDGARRNISRHYDLSNEFFALFLDETMTYSAALFETGPDGLPVAAEPALVQETVLAQAQRRKIDRLLDEARVGPGTRLLEIGTGWGELAIRAGQRGADVRTVTISARQRELAAQRVAEARLAGRVSVELRDYRDVAGEFDAVCSVEMIEAVGERYWDTYFAQLDRLLAPGGRVGLQAITMPHDRMLASRHTYTWIQKYIFPGGLIPSVAAIEDSLGRTRLRVTGRLDFGAHYARTLSMWRDRFLARGPEVAALGFDEVFARMWRFYLCYSEAGFRSGYLDVSQFTLERA